MNVPLFSAGAGLVDDALLQNLGLISFFTVGPEEVRPWTDLQAGAFGKLQRESSSNGVKLRPLGVASNDAAIPQVRLRLPEHQRGNPLIPALGGFR